MIVDTCQEAVPALFDEQKRVKVKDVRVDDDRASGSIDAPGGGSVGAIKEDGEWRIGPIFAL